MQYNSQLSLYSIYCVLGMHRSGPVVWLVF